MPVVSEEQIEEVSREVSSRYSLTEANAAYRAQAYEATHAAWPTLHLDDVSGIPFLQDILGVELYQLRARVRAREGDAFAATCPELIAYEQYNRTQLGLGDATFVYAEAGEAPIEIGEACRQGSAFRSLVAFARRVGRLGIHPYMGIESVWELARDIHEQAGVPVSVLAPPPPVTWLANDKGDLSAVVEALLGSEALVETLRGTSAESLASHLRELARRHTQVALKMTRCASAMGNQLFAASEIMAKDPAGLVQIAADFLREKEWDGESEVLAVAWETADSSPSTQLWIPPLGAGSPLLDGVYEQLLVGEKGVFLGSIPSGLEPQVNEWLGAASLAVASVFQRLGYVGRCSFDFIQSAAGIRFVECNGRWGGTSTPMHLMDRLFPAGRPAYRARDFVSPELSGVPFEQLAESIGEHLYDRRTGQGRYILYNLGCLDAHGKFDVIALGEDVSDASRALEENFPAIVASL